MKKERIVNTLLRKKITQEYTKFRESTIKGMSRAEIYSQSYKITVMFELYLIFLRRMELFSHEEKKALHRMPDIFGEIFRHWKTTEVNTEEVLINCIRKCAEIEMCKMEGGENLQWVI